MLPLATVAADLGVHRLYQDGVARKEDEANPAVQAAMAEAWATAEASQDAAAAIKTTEEHALSLRAAAFLRVRKEEAAAAKEATAADAAEAADGKKAAIAAELTAVVDRR